MPRRPVASRTARHRCVSCAVKTARCRKRSNHCSPPTPARRRFWTTLRTVTCEDACSMPSRARSKTRPACSRPGDRLGAYEITGFLGRGGMGEVYRARDTKLGRDVAIKILPDAFASDAERLGPVARARRSARGAQPSAHRTDLRPGGSGKGSGALVMELVDGVYPRRSHRRRRRPRAERPSTSSGRPEFIEWAQARRDRLAGVGPRGKIKKRGLTR